MSTSERNPVGIITSHQATILALMEPTIANIREPLTEAELTTYQRFVCKLNESAQAAQEACVTYETLIASKALKKLSAARTDRPHRPQDSYALQEKLGGVPSSGERGYAGVGLAR